VRGTDSKNILTLNALHKLKGDRKGPSAMTANDRRRTCFQFRKGDAHDVEIVDCHRGWPLRLPADAA
jgi:plasmid maintenance system killer protein